MMMHVRIRAKTITQFESLKQPNSSWYHVWHYSDIYLTVNKIFKNLVSISILKNFRYWMDPIMLWIMLLPYNIIYRYQHHKTKLSGWNLSKRTRQSPLYLLLNRRALHRTCIYHLWFPCYSHLFVQAESWNRHRLSWNLVTHKTQSFLSWCEWKSAISH